MFAATGACEEVYIATVTGLSVVFSNRMLTIPLNDVAVVESCELISTDRLHIADVSEWSECTV